MFNLEKPELKVDRAYFVCGYYLRNMPIPNIETCVYVGSNLFESDASSSELMHYFKNPETYFAKEIASEHEDTLESQSDEQPRYIRIPESGLEALVYDYEGLKKWVSQLGAEPNASDCF